MDEAAGCLFLLSVIAAALYALMALGVSMALLLTLALIVALCKGIGWVARKALGVKDVDTEE